LKAELVKSNPKGGCNGCVYYSSIAGFGIDGKNHCSILDSPECGMNMIYIVVDDVPDESELTGSD
jgi:hypothetical protein